jgi:hypothetical protein
LGHGSALIDPSMGGRQVAPAGQSRHVGLEGGIADHREEAQQQRQHQQPDHAEMAKRAQHRNG